MSLFTYTGPPGHVWPDIPSSGVSKIPDVGDVVEWGDRVPDEACWEEAPEDAVAYRAADHREDNELGKLTKAGLVALAASEGLELSESSKKDDLIAAIEAHRAGDHSQEPSDPDTASDADTSKE